MAGPSCPFTGFEEFWPVYVRSHQSQTNRILHLLGTLSVIPMVILASKISWVLLVLIPAIAYSFAWIGHVFFEKNRPATFDYPLWSMRGDMRMCGLMLAGLMSGELEKHAGKQPVD